MRRDRGPGVALIACAIVLVLMLTMPLSSTREDGKSASALANGSRVFTIGCVDLTSQLTTLNPFRYTSTAEYMTIWPCFSTLLTYDENGHLMGDLATWWDFSQDGLTWDFGIADNAYFCDPANPSDRTHQVTVADVIYSYWVTSNYSSSLQLSLPRGLIQSMSSSDQFTMRMVLNYPFAPILQALASIPIVPKYYWQPHQNPTGDPTGWSAAMPIGSGAFYYALPGLPTAGQVILQRNPMWFQEANRGWQIHVDTLKYKTETDAGTAWLELQNGLIDVMMGVPPPVYLESLPAEISAGNMVGWAVSTGFVYEYNLNQMTDAMRASLGSPFNTGTSNRLLQDPVVRKAMAMSVNKPAFISTILSGLGSVADSLCPDVSPWHYHYPDPVVFNTAQARADLNAAGWAYDVNGNYAPSTTPLYKKSITTGLGVDPLRFRFYSLTTGDDWIVGSILIKSWAAEAGVQLDLTLMTVGQLNVAWSSADYDVWLWDWMFAPTSDISTDIMSVLTTDQIGGWQDVFWSNATYDALYNMSLTTVDPPARRIVTDQMQAIAYESFTCQLVAYRKELYAASLSRWTGYGDWEESVMLLPELALPYLYMRISPNGPDSVPSNQAPVITSLNAVWECLVGDTLMVNAAASDTSALEYQWYWGDGTSSGWSSSPASSHAYMMEGMYTIYFAAREVGTADQFVTWGSAIARIVDPTNAAPYGLNIIWTPTTPYASQDTTFTGTALDDDDDPLYYSWNFGDTHTAQGSTVTHKYMAPGSYTVTLSVTDNHHLGPEPRPVQTSALVVVTENQSPEIYVPDFGIRGWKMYTQYNITASDSDDSLRFTWYWRDGSSNVTTSPTAWHTYSKKGVYTIQVYADDLTGLPGHNVTDSGTVSILSTETPPYGLLLTVDNPSPFQDELISFTGTAKDASGEALRFTFSFGDDTYANVNTVGAGATPVTAVVTHSYSTPGTMSAYLYVSDGLDNVSTAFPLVITVRVPNQPPSVTPLANMTGDPGQPLSFSASAYDPDDDAMDYTWDFGDGSALAVGQTVPHAYAAAGTYTFSVHVSDGHGNNVTSSATASIAFILDLAPGWNMVSVPLVGYGYNASTLGLATDDVVSGWNSSSQTYDKNYIVNRSPARNDFEIAESTGYWVYAGTAETLRLYGTVPTAPQTITITVPTGGGWALIGFLGLKTRHASDIPAMYSGGVGAVITAVAAYNVTTETYNVHVVGVPRTDFLLVPGQGYWIYCTQSGTLTYDP